MITIEMPLSTIEREIEELCRIDVASAGNLDELRGILQVLLWLRSGGQTPSEYFRRGHSV